MAHRVETAFVFDLDGTLIDSVYQHVLAWQEALDDEGIELAVWRIHRKIGMSGGLFTNMLLRETGHDFDAQRIARLRQRHADIYNRTSPKVRPLPGARELLLALRDADIPFAIATSGRMETARPALEKLGVDFARTPIVTRDEVKYAKPEPDLFFAAAERLRVARSRRVGRRRQRLGHARGDPRPIARSGRVVWRIRAGGAGAVGRLSRLRRSGRRPSAPGRTRRTSLTVPGRCMLRAYRTVGRLYGNQTFVWRANMRRWGLMISLALLVSSPLLAQISTGSIAGTVMDRGAGVLTNAAVTVTNRATGAARTTQSGAMGHSTCRRCRLATTTS